MRLILGAALGAVGCLATTVAAQSPLNQPGFVAGGPAAVAGVAHALDQTSRGADSNFVNAYGEPFVTPAQYCDPMQGCYGGGGGGGYGPPGTGGEPFGGAYLNTEQCGPHYFDFSAEYLHYTRDAAFTDLPISYSGFAAVDTNDQFLANFNDNVVMRSGEVSSDSLDGFRLTGRVDVGALSVFEVSYSGLYDSDEAVADVSANETTARLFSVFSRYGTRTNGPTGDSTAGRPIADVVAPNNNPGGNNYAETDFASRHELSYESELHNAEALFRRYWVGANPRVSGTILLGFRYTSLSEQMGFSSIGSSGATNGPFAPDPSLRIDINADADNHLAGFECGADAWVTVVQGLRVGAEGKVGVYNNDYNVTTSSVAVDGSPSTFSTVAGDQVAFLTEFKAMAVADVTPCISLKAGYELLFISEVAMAGDSLLFAAPYGNPNGATGAVGGAPPTTDNDIVFHGFHAGFEYVW